MTPQQEEVIQQIQSLRESAESAGLVEADPWASLDSLWKGPDVDVEKIAALGQDTLNAVRQAHADGTATAALIQQALDLTRVLLPVALAQL